MNDKEPLEMKEQTAKVLLSISRTVQVIAIVAILFVIIQFILQSHLLG